LVNIYILNAIEKNVSAHILKGIIVVLNKIPTTIN
jgi:hypothetical protein